MQAASGDSTGPGAADGPDGPVRLERTARGELTAHIRGAAEPAHNVQVARCFPWSLRGRYISIRDSEGKELLLLADLSELDEATAALIEEELREKFFVPKIRRIVSYSAEFGLVSVTAETDRGEVSFQLRDREDVRLLSPTRAVFRDVDGNLYEVEDFEALDSASRKHIEQHF